MKIMNNSIRLTHKICSKVRDNQKENFAPDFETRIRFELGKWLWVGIMGNFGKAEAGG